MNESLIEELKEGLSLKRLYHTGLFIRISVPEEHEELTAEIRLHRAVLDRALIDQFHPNKAIKRDVEKWLHLKNRDFIEACERADLKPELVFKTFSIIKDCFKDQTNEYPKLFQ